MALFSILKKLSDGSVFQQVVVLSLKVHSVEYDKGTEVMTFIYF